MNSAPRPIRKETAALLNWYDANARVLPWRNPPRSNLKADPYHVWLSEIMLQQTQVATVKPYYEKFLKAWPNVQDLADADLEDILKAWAGLGYYSRARNLKKCAEMICRQFDGLFPANATELMKLPGIGPYTSAAISAIAFGKSEAVVDGNVERVISRMYSIKTPLPRSKPEIYQLTKSLVPEFRAGDIAQAMMDLGATICTPKNPACNECPWVEHCSARANGLQTQYPVKLPKKIPPTRRGAAFIAMTKDGYFLLRKRPERGMLAGMSEVPSTNWSAQHDGETGVNAAPMTGEWCHIGDVRHTFTHFKLDMKVYYCQVQKTDGWWVHRDLIIGEALPVLMKKVITLALKAKP